MGDPSLFYLGVVACGNMMAVISTLVDVFTFAANLSKMRYLILIVATMCAISFHAQVFNFYGTEYYLSPDSGTNDGTVLTASGTNLSGFDYTWADPQHPLFTTGIFFPVQDCGNRNLWVRLQHVAHDPNGQDNGFNIAQTLNSPFLPLGSTDRIGGWAGFLYDIQIFADENLTGTRANILDGLFPTNITVESLETLYNNGDTLYEWLSFVIMNEESSGWVLNSTNFTGINPYSTPGFSAELNYSTTGTSTQAPTGFSTDFPGGSMSIYAVDMNLSAAYHSEFRMSAGNVSHFQYGYEFTTGGYQGMSMAFGSGPVVNAELQVPCDGGNSGYIHVTATGYEPISYAWTGGDNDSNLDEIGAGDYTVTITDGVGCTIEETYTVVTPEPLVVSIDTYEGSGYIELTAAVEGGSGNYSIGWSTGETGNYIDITEYGSYTVTITDVNGCIAEATFIFQGLSESIVGAVSFYPNPASGVLYLSAQRHSGTLSIYDLGGQLVKTWTIDPNTNFIDISTISPGIYWIRHASDGESVKYEKLVVR